MFLKSKYFLLLILFFAQCRWDKKTDVPEMGGGLQTMRFELDVREHAGNISYLQNKYGDFFELFVTELVPYKSQEERMRMTRDGMDEQLDTSALRTHLQDFITNSDISDIYSRVDSLYRDFSGVNTKINDAFNRYKYHFPDKTIPQIMTFISGFTYSIVCIDSALGIGLDMYLGTETPYYPGIGLPQFKIRNMQKPYIVADAMRGWTESEWERDEARIDLLSNMIYQGKILYCVKQLLPDEPDSIITGYSQAQLKWCRENEATMWGFLIDQRLLFSTDQSKIGKYISEGPTTGGFPKESPGNIGQWMGLRIVESYMKTNEKITLSQLMDMEDFQKLFNESGYKPKR